jgi:hypothetical protein
MRWKHQVIAVGMSTLLLTGHAVSQTPVPNSYPAPRCGQPKFEALPQAEDSKAPDQTKANFYAYELRQYNREVEAYGACMRKYIAKANRDAQRIQTQANSDVKRITDNANASIAVIRAQIRKAMANVKRISNASAK